VDEEPVSTHLKHFTPTFFTACRKVAGVVKGEGEAVTEEVSATCKAPIKRLLRNHENFVELWRNFRGILVE
jgi:hypothetical protein